MGRSTGSLVIRCITDGRDRYAVMVSTLRHRRAMLNTAADTHGALLANASAHCGLMPDVTTSCTPGKEARTRHHRKKDTKGKLHARRAP